MMNKLVFSIALGVLASAIGAHAEESGQALHDKQCVSCHTSMTNNNPSFLYTRPNRKVKDMSGLQNQVQRCELQLGLGWFDSEISAVTGYLNQAFYHFPEK